MYFELTTYWSDCAITLCKLTSQSKVQHVTGAAVQGGATHGKVGLQQKHSIN